MSSTQKIERYSGERERLVGTAAASYLAPAASFMVPYCPCSRLRTRVRPYSGPGSETDLEDPVSLSKLKIKQFPYERVVRVEKVLQCIT